ncbi:hypothetical protein AMTR_s00091p00114070 [Amborella trichopoda]|uniref:Uncharacterized protein n=1 Tax=Amborella trichopoda TaxID=13333 RepID=W1NZ77_AMBTC|nr:hypothetical protein AMTR_s00091p00114070 [Amborella trichopoda]
MSTTVRSMWQCVSVWVWAQIKPDSVISSLKEAFMGTPGYKKGLNLFLPFYLGKRKIAKCFGFKRKWTPASREKRARQSMFSDERSTPKKGKKKVNNSDSRQLPGSKESVQLPSVEATKGSISARVKGTDELAKCREHSARQQKDDHLQRRTCEGGTYEGDNNMWRTAVRGTQQQAALIGEECAASKREDNEKRW